MQWQVHYISLHEDTVETALMKTLHLPIIYTKKLWTQLILNIKDATTVV